MIYHPPPAGELWQSLFQASISPLSFASPPGVGIIEKSFWSWGNVTQHFIAYLQVVKFFFLNYFTYGKLRLRKLLAQLHTTSLY